MCVLAARAAFAAGSGGEKVICEYRAVGTETMTVLQRTENGPIKVLDVTKHCPDGVWVMFATGLESRIEPDLSCEVILWENCWFPAE
jgi:hypothetical protein